MTLTAPAKPRTPTIGGRLADHVWILGCPLLALLVLQVLWRATPFADLQIYAVLFAVVVTGHHMPGWLRAFGEPVVYERHKARLWVSVLAIPAIVILPTAMGFGMLPLFVAALFDLWHVAMQQHGFGRIYGAKSGDVARRSARIDLACVLVWYTTAVAWSDAWMQGLAGAFRRAGLPLFQHVTPEVWSAARWTLALASLALLAAYLDTATRLWRAERRVAGHKHLLHGIAFAVLFASYQDSSWYRAQSVQNLFHAAQYFFMVWIYGHLSVRKDPVAPRAFYRVLFAHRRGIGLYAGAIGLYGAGAWMLSSSGYRVSGWSAERSAQVIGSIGVASLLLHYYVDSFIWKVRAQNVRRTLGIAGEGVSAEPAKRPSHARGAAHATLYFGAPLALVALVGQGRRDASPTERAAALSHEAALFPSSAEAWHLHGRSLAELGHPQGAHEALVRAHALSPSTPGPAALLAELARRTDGGETLRWLREAVRVAPGDVEQRYALAAALAGERELDEAEEQYLEVLRRAPDLAPAHENLGVLYKWKERLDLAVPCFRRAVELDPDLSPAVCNLAGSLATLGQGEEGLRILAEFRARHPEERAAAGLEAGSRAALAR